MYKREYRNINYKKAYASMKNHSRISFLFLILILLNSCSSQKFLNEGQSVLSEVKLTSTQKNFNAGKYRGYIKQEPNTKWFTLVKVPLGIYCMSKKDSVKGNKGFSKVLKNIGEAPVIYSSTLTETSAQHLRQAMKSQGYLYAKVDTVVTQHKHKKKVEYILTPGSRFYVDSINYEFDSPQIYKAYKQDSMSSLLHKGMPLDLNVLSEERSRAIRILRDKGFYYVNNDFIKFNIDTISGSLGTIVNLEFAMPPNVDSSKVYQVQRYRTINIYEFSENDSVNNDMSFYRGLSFNKSGHTKLNKRLYFSHIGLRSDSIYRETEIQKTYGNLNALPAINYTTLSVQPVPGYVDQLDCNIQIRPTKPHSIGFEIEGTNTSGDFGAAVALSYSNRNLFRGSEKLSLKLRGAYEAITGLEGYNNQNYIEWSTELNLRFPTLLLPFVSLEKKRSLKAYSDAQLMFDMQDRPEFHRRVLTWNWIYRWSKTNNSRLQHRYDLFSLNYVYMPWISDTFRKEYLQGDDPHYSVLRYSYEDLFIMKTGYGFVYNSLRDAINQPTGLYQKNGYQIKMGIEFAGNLLYGMSKMVKSKKHSNGCYQFLGIAYSQYAKFDFDFAQSIVLSEKNSLAFHIAFGIGLPYGNSTILPYEKRYFAGGANGIRGWNVRGLGPGSYKGKDGKVDFINQTGNLKLDLSVEWRTHLFWKLHGAFFIDAGNIWNTRKYPDMEGSLFKLNSFYKQIAVSYGLGIRLNLDYFILRLDGGMKAIDPSVTSGRLHYPISKPDFNRDFTLHFAVGLPF